MVIGQILGVEPVIAFMDKAGSNVHQVLRTEVRQLAVMLMGYVKTNKLTGEVLHVKTGRLRRSITAKVTEGGTLISGVVGTNVEYAAAHEFGVNQFKIVTVRAYLRRCKSRDRYKMKKGKYFSLQGAAAKVTLAAEGMAYVHSFSRNQHTKLPERSFLRSALEELGPGIREDLAAAVMGAMK